VGLTSSGTKTVTRTLSFADKLGLSPGSRCVVFDFWNQKLFGVFKDQMKVEIGSHDTLVVSRTFRNEQTSACRHVKAHYRRLFHPRPSLGQSCQASGRFILDDAWAGLDTLVLYS